MSFKINTDKLEDCIGNLDTAMALIKQALEIVGKLKIPDDFTEKDKISYVKDTALPDVKSGITKEREHIEGLINKSINAEQNLKQFVESMINSIPGMDIVKEASNKGKEKIIVDTNSSNGFAGKIWNTVLGMDIVKEASNKGKEKIIVDTNSSNDGSISINPNYNSGSNGNVNIGDATNKENINNNINEKPKEENVNIGNTTNKEDISNNIEEKPKEEVEVSDPKEPVQTIEPETIYNEKIEQTKILDYVSDETADAIKDRVLRDYEEQKVIIDEMTDPEFYRYILEATGGLMTIEEYLTVVELENNTFGASETVFIEMEKEYPEEYERIKDILMTKYEFTEEDSEMLISQIGEKGTGEYAKDVNTIIEYFRNDPETFKEIFGYDLYVDSKEGQVLLNDKELMVDYYNWVSKAQQETPIEGEELEFNMLNEFLQSKSENLVCKTEVLLTNSSEENNSQQIMGLIEERLENGESISITLTAKEGELLQFIDMDTSTIHKEVSENYVAKIIDSTEDGIVATVDGKKCIIGYEDLLSDSESYKIVSDSIEMTN